jgi:hypothetical protein
MLNYFDVRSGRGPAMLLLLAGTLFGVSGVAYSQDQHPVLTEKFGLAVGGVLSSG